jgi:adenylosuccinate lyase
MIERYALSPIKDIWTQEEQYRRWLEVELAVIKAKEDLDLIQKGIYDLVKSKASIDVENILEIEKEVDHDVIAFIKSVTKDFGDEERYFHKGLTSSDIVDTALSLGMVRSATLIQKELKVLAEIMKEKAIAHKNTITIGRTHGMHAEPTSFGLKLLSYYDELERNEIRIDNSIKNISHAKMSGAVGNYANIDPAIEEKALAYLGLVPCKVSTQIVPRDIHCEFLNSLALLGTCIERFATEIRHLQRTEVGEAQEPFKKGQRGSSAMPHKKNPILCERLCGMARILRGNAIVSYENVPLWHERDISHSSAERMIIQDSIQIIYYMVLKSQSLIKGLIVNERRMLENFDASLNLVFSQNVLNTLIDSGMKREDAYTAIQEIAFECFRQKRDFKILIKENDHINQYIQDKDIDRLFEKKAYLQNVDTIFRKFENDCH